MTYDETLNKLQNLKHIMNNNLDSSVAYHQAGQKYDAILFANMSFREYSDLIKKSNHEFTVEDDAKLVIASEQNKDLRNVVLHGQS